MVPLALPPGPTAAARRAGVPYTPVPGHRAPDGPTLPHRWRTHSRPLPGARSVWQGALALSAARCLAPGAPAARTASAA